MRFRQLGSFVRVCQLGSITRAAAELNIAQPALGLQIRNLEAEFGADLIVRSPRGVSPTPAGVLVLAWAKEILKGANMLRREVRELSAETRPALSVGLTPSLTTMIALDLVENSDQELPKLELKIVEGFSRNIAHWVETEEIDLGLSFHASDSSLVECIPLLTERLCYISAPDPSRVEGTIDLSDALRLPLAIPGEGDSIRQAVEKSARSIDLPVLCKYELSSLEAAKGLARKGIAGAILPFGGVRGSPQNELSVRMVVAPPVIRTLYLIRRADREIASSEQHLVDILRRILRSLAISDHDLGSYLEFIDPVRMST